MQYIVLDEEKFLKEYFIINIDKFLGMHMEYLIKYNEQDNIPVNYFNIQNFLKDDRKMEYYFSNRTNIKINDIIIHCNIMTNNNKIKKELKKFKVKEINKNIAFCENA